MKTTIELVKKELAYHQRNRGKSGRDTQWELGFLAGLKHVLKLAKQIKPTPSPNKKISNARNAFNELILDLTKRKKTWTLRQRHFYNRCAKYFNPL